MLLRMASTSFGRWLSRPGSFCIVVLVFASFLTEESHAVATSSIFKGPRFAKSQHSLRRIQRRRSEHKLLTQRINPEKRTSSSVSTLAQMDDGENNAVFTLAEDSPERINIKGQILQLACALDRGQLYNPQRSGAYKERALKTKQLIEELIEKTPPLPTSMEALDGEWELIYSTVKYGIFRSSPFFLAVQEAFGDDRAFGWVAQCLHCVAIIYGKQHLMTSLTK
eukprot:jgi/Bigna1/91422/estExt_fgenesh1_pg.C_1000037